MSKWKFYKGGIKSLVRKKERKKERKRNSGPRARRE
jgi:hypothetical protein